MMLVPCQVCGKPVNVGGPTAHKLYIALRRPDFHEAEIDTCSPECAAKGGAAVLASLVPAPEPPVADR